ncbi:MAG: DoxX family protein [Streptosporangiales bacterium]|nr:DoxX family protein [Streptosporangiales bacterium]
MKVMVWIVSALLALAFLFIGGTKVFTPTDVMEQMSEGVPVIMLRIAGLAEMVGAVGLILPAATRIAPVLTPIAASGLVVVMVGASIINVIIGFYPTAAQTVVLGLLAAFVAWARFTRQSVAPRTAVQPLEA